MSDLSQFANPEDNPFTVKAIDSVLWSEAYPIQTARVIGVTKLHPEMFSEQGFIKRRGKDDYVKFDRDFVHEKLKHTFFSLRHIKREILLDEITKALDEIQEVD